MNPFFSEKFAEKIAIDTVHKLMYV